MAKKRNPTAVVDAKIALVIRMLLQNFNYPHGLSPEEQIAFKKGLVITDQSIHELISKTVAFRDIRIPRQLFDDLQAFSKRMVK